MAVSRTILELLNFPSIHEFILDYYRNASIAQKLMFSQTIHTHFQQNCQLVFEHC